MEKDQQLELYKKMLSLYENSYNMNKIGLYYSELTSCGICNCACLLLVEDHDKIEKMLLLMFDFAKEKGLYRQKEFWWPKGEYAKRIEFLQELIKKIENNEIRVL